MNTREEGSSSAETPEFSGDTLNGVPLVSDTHHLLLHPGAKQFLILLSATGTKPGSFNLWKHADALPYHKLYLRVPINDWYQQGVPGLGADPEETYASIRRLIEGTGAEKVYTIGSSMGAYGALLFGHELDASVLAFSPEIVLDLPFSRSSKMIPGDVTRTVPDLRERLAAAERPVFIYTGEMDPVDLYCAAMIRKLSNINIVTFRDDEHTVMRTLFHTERLIPTIRAFVEDQPLPSIMEKGNALNFAAYPRHFYRGWQYFQNKQDDIAEEEFQKALKAYPVSARVNFFMARILLRRGEAAKAREHAALAVAMTPNFIEHRFLFAHCLRMTGAMDGAIYCHQKILEAWPDADQSHFDLGQMYLMQKQFDLAGKHFAEAVRLAPHNASYARKLEKLSEQMSASE
ncbi:Tetratricopeptide repeat protein (plasmid) [Marinovum algicola DG 898]|nr:Tetratricopeptide repeat protein [Marinovum algicola DG 898]